jgi:hypothetical protein
MRRNLVQRGFEFKFELVLFFLFSPITCKGTSNFLIQVSQSKFTVLKIMLRKIFCEFMGFFPKGLNPLKFKPNSNLILFVDFYFKIHLEFELLPKRKVVPFDFSFHHVKFGHFWSYRSTLFRCYMFDLV